MSDQKERTPALAGTGGPEEHQAIERPDGANNAKCAPFVQSTSGHPRSLAGGSEPEAGSARLVEIEQRLLGWQLNGMPHATQIASAEMRDDAEYFQRPHDRIQATIFDMLADRRAVAVESISAALVDDPAMQGIGGRDYLHAIAAAAPAWGSERDGRILFGSELARWRELSGSRDCRSRVHLVRGDEVAPRAIDWVWPGWLAAGKLHLLAGKAGAGKTTLALGLAATMSSGGRFPDGHEVSAGSTAVWSGEDDFSDSLLPRFLACGGNPARLHFVGGYDDGHGRRPFDPAEDLPELARALRRVPDLRLVIVDPVAMAVPASRDSHKNAEVRRSLAPLFELALSQNAAVLGVTHFTKGTAGHDPLERVIGSVAFGAMPRLVMVAARPNDANQKRRLIRAKSNVGPDGDGFEYGLERIALASHPDVEAQRPTWGAQLTGSARDLLGELEDGADERASVVERASEWLQNFLAGGPRLQTMVEEAGIQVGFSKPALRRAKERLRVQSVKKADHWLWLLPDGS